MILESLRFLSLPVFCLFHFSMNRRTSVAGVDELKHAFEQTSISLQDGSLFNNKSNGILKVSYHSSLGIRQIGICDSDDSDDVDELK